MKEEVKDKSIKNVPVSFWNKFAGRCKERGMTVTQGFIEATTEWMKKK